MYWNQEGVTHLKPDITLQHYDPLYTATRLHFEVKPHVALDYFNLVYASKPPNMISGEPQASKVSSYIVLCSMTADLYLTSDACNFTT